MTHRSDDHDIKQACATNPRRLPDDRLEERCAACRLPGTEQRRALHEYRDEVSRKRRRCRELLDAAIGESSFPRFELDDASRDTLAGWRAPVTLPGMDQGLSVDDPTDPALEPDLREFERRGDGPEHNR